MLRIIFRFGVVGVLNTLIDYCLFQIFVHLFSLHSPVSLFFASMVSGGIAVINSFVLNKKWTFEDKSTKHIHQFIRFLVINLLSLGLNSLTVAMLEHVTQGHLIIASHTIQSVYLTKGVAIVLTMIVNFFAYRIFVFKKNGEEYTVAE